MGSIRRILPPVGSIVHMIISLYREIKAIKVTKGQVKIMDTLLKTSTMSCRLLHKWRKSIKATRQEIIKISVPKRYPNSL